MRVVTIDGGPLQIADVVDVADGCATVTVGPNVAERMAPARRLVEEVVAESRTVYGITTGFGRLATSHIESDQAARLQIGLLRSHAAGVGERLRDRTVRAMLLLRARTLSQGYSGVRPIIVVRLVEMLNRGLLPVVPGQGSVGASGDLAPFAHLALPLIGEGQIRVDGVEMDAAEALAAAGLDPIVLAPKEGLSLLNGTEGMLALGVLALARARSLVNAADIACALSVEGLLGSSKPFMAKIHKLRPHPGQITSAANIARLLEGSGIVASHAHDMVHAVQDAYSLRCAPQVHGATRDTLTHAEAVFTRELGSVVDNPIVFAEDGTVVSGGNFHGQPLAVVLDFLAIAVTELGSISERRTDRILDPDRSAGLPAFLAPNPGINSGYMLAQYTAAALVAENRVLSHPASVESIPTSGSQEDHVSMGWGAGRKLHEVLANTAHVIAVEVMCAVAAIEHRAPLAAAELTREAVARVRRVVSALEDDRPIGPDIEAIASLLSDGGLDELVDS
ncbi:MAG: histidine ammonia-lyase [Actinomycetota bacterium]|nr:histidine ammonia-lyase [Actinomycetota bacterium]